MVFCQSVFLLAERLWLQNPKIQSLLVGILEKDIPNPYLLLNDLYLLN